MKYNRLYSTLARLGQRLLEPVAQKSSAAVTADARACCSALATRVLKLLRLLSHRTAGDMHRVKGQLTLIEQMAATKERGKKGFAIFHNKLSSASDNKIESLKVVKPETRELNP